MDGSGAARTAAARRLSDTRGRVVAVACDEDLLAALGPTTVERATLSEALADVEEGRTPDLVVIGPELDAPLAFLQRLHRIDRTLAAVLLADDEKLPALAHSVLVAPFVGADVMCRSASDALLPTELAEMAEHAAQRRRFKATLASASAQLTAATAEQPQSSRVAGRLLDDAPLGIVTLSEEGSVVGWNRRAAELFGRVERDVLGNRFASLVLEQSQAALDSLVTAPVDVDARPATALLEIEAGDGIRFLAATASRITGREGDEAVLLMLQDDTERVVATRELETARAELAFLVEAGAALAAPTRLADALQVLAQVAVPTFADATIVDLIQGDTIRRVAVAANDADALGDLEEVRRRYPPTHDSPQPAAQALRRGEPLLMQFDEQNLRETCSDEEHYALMRRVAPVSAIVVPLVAREQMLGALTFIRRRGSARYDDRSVEVARRVGDRASLYLDNVRLLQDAQERARAARVIDAITDGVFLVDADDRVLLWNPAAARIVGVESHAVIGRKLDDLVPGWLAIAPSVPVAATGEAVRPLTLPLELGGAERWIAVAGIALEDGIVYAFRDVTSDVALEQMRSTFVATVSHELRTPLASVYGAAVTLQRPGIADDATKRQEMTQIIIEEGERLARLVDDILVASRLDAGSMDVAAERVDLGEVAARAVDAARRNLDSAGRVNLRAAEGCYAVADPDRARQVLANLIENALKYSPQDAPVHVEVDLQGASVRVCVRDRGIGIPFSEQSRVFEKFYRADPEQTRGVGGTGLGLYISRELVRRMGGRIGVDSQPGVGSSFFVDLPRAT